MYDSQSNQRPAALVLRTQLSHCCCEKVVNLALPSKRLSHPTLKSSIPVDLKQLIKV